MILEARRRWVCPNCDREETVTAGADNRFHPCPALGGFLAPMVPGGTDCRVVAVVREDYVGAEDVQTNGDGQPVMSVLTEYGDGRTDCAVFAPTAHVRRS